MMSMSLTTPKAVSQPVKIIDRWARRILLSRIAQLQRGRITLEDTLGAASFGQLGDLHVRCHVHQPRFFRQAVLGGTLSVAESYLRGDWDCDDLTTLFRIFARNNHTAQGLDSGLARIAATGHRWWHRWRANSRSGSRRNIKAHYDLGNEFFRLWLDDTLAYSSGIFLTPEATLREASIEKFDRVCRKLDLRPTDRVLEIGSGWGGFALHAAGHYGCRVTTTTISQEQYDAVGRRIDEAGLDDRIELLQRDYRDLTGEFDKLVSIEMLEAVGHRYLDAYFQRCGQLLRPDGSLVLQTIVMPERRHAHYLRSVDFIRRYVFPGGCLPSLGSILDSVGRTTDLRFVHAEDIAPHYAETARRWRWAFEQRCDEIRSLGYSTEFIRLWKYYLSYCEAVFEERHVGILQIQFDKPQCRRDALQQGADESGARQVASTVRNMHSTEAFSRSSTPCGAT